MNLRDAFLFPLLCTASVAYAADCTEDAMIVFDGSGSMAEVGFNQMDEPRIFEAREAVAQAIPDIALHRRLGLVVYGPGGADACSGLDLRLRPRADSAGLIIAAVNGLIPDGDTALTAAVALAADALDYRSEAGAIVLVTDGKETCAGAPCQLAATLAADAHDLTVHVIGFRVRGDYFAWHSQGDSDYLDADTPAACLADRTGGTYVTVETLDELTAAFRETLGCALLF